MTFWGWLRSLRAGLNCIFRTAAGSGADELTFRDELIALRACPEAVKWVGDRTREQAWAECERGDWTLGYAAAAGLSRKELVLAICACVGLRSGYPDLGLLTVR